MAWLDDINRLLQTGGNALNFFSQLNPNTQTQGGSTNLFGLNIPNQLAGVGLLGAGEALDKEPGQVTEARQFLRNRFTSPNALSDQFSGQISGLMNSYQPLLTQQRQRGIEDISQRFAAAFPKTVGAQGPEFGTLARYITDEALPREQAVMGDIGQWLVNKQGEAASTILAANKPDPLSQLSTLLGYDLLTRNRQGQGVSTLIGQNGQPIGQVGSNGQLSGIQSQLISALNAAQTSGNTSQLVSLLASGIFRGMPFPIGVQASTPAGQIIQQAINAGLVESPAAQVVGQGATTGGFQGLLGAAGAGSAAALASAAASALAGGYLGYKVGSAIGDAIESPGSTATGFKTALGGGASGAAAGAATGALIGDGPGAVIGAIIGGIAGIFGGSGAERRREDAQREAEAAFTSQNRPAILQVYETVKLEAPKLLAELAPYVSLNGYLNSYAYEGVQKGDAELLALDKRVQTLTGNPNSHLDGFFMAAKDNIETMLFDANDPGVSPESIRGLINSSETGRFEPGVKMAQDRVTKGYESAKIIFDYLNLLKQRGLI